MRAFYVMGMVAAVTVGSAALAGDTLFTPDAAATWSARSMRMAKIVDVSFGDSVTKESFGNACAGLTGEQMKHEYGKEPRWALSAQIDICSGYDGWAGKFQHSKAPCKALEMGLGELDKANAATDPAEVTAAATALREALNMILTSAKSNRACKIR